MVSAARSALTGRLVLLVLVPRLTPHLPILPPLLAPAHLLFVGGRASTRLWRVRRAHFFLRHFAVAVFVEGLQRL